MKFTLAAACLFSATMANEVMMEQMEMQLQELQRKTEQRQIEHSQLLDNLEDDVSDIESYLGVPYINRSPGETVTKHIQDECNNEIENSKRDIKDYTLQHMARQMLDAFGNKDQMTVEMFHWVPTVVFDRHDCWGPAEVVSVPANFVGQSENSWSYGALEERGMDNKISSVLVPPGYKLELYDESWEDTPYTVVGKMRDDGAGIKCQQLGGLNNKTSQLKLIEF